MKLKLYEEGKTALVQLVGRLDQNTSEETERLLLEQCERFDKLVLDLSELEYISSSGLRVIKSLHLAMSKKGGRLVLKNTRDLLMEVFEMTGFSGLLSFE